MKAALRDTGDHEVGAPDCTLADRIRRLQRFAPFELMRFRLVYDGPLPAAGRSTRRDEKHAIRKVIRSQLGELLATHKGLVAWAKGAMGQEPTPPEVFTVRDYRFIPLISRRLNLLCHLDILLLRREPLGKVVREGGDIDNRLKTLFDALRMPHVEQEIPPGATPELAERPYFLCLLEDDSLISGFSVETDTLLTPCHKDPADVQVIMNVQVKVTEITPDVLGLLGD